MTERYHTISIPCQLYFQLPISEIPKMNLSEEHGNKMNMNLPTNEHYQQPKSH